MVSRFGISGEFSTPPTPSTLHVLVSTFRFWLGCTFGIPKTPQWLGPALLLTLLTLGPCFFPVSCDRPWAKPSACFRLSVMPSASQRESFFIHSAGDDDSCKGLFVYDSSTASSRRQYQVSLVCCFIPELIVRLKINMLHIT